MRSVCPHVTLCRGFRCSVFFFPSFYEACQVLTVALVHKMRVSKAAQVWNLWNSHNKPIGPWRLFNRTMYYCVSLSWKIWSHTNLFGLYGIVKIAQHIASNALLPANGIFVNVLIQMIWWCSFTTFFFFFAFTGMFFRWCIGTCVRECRLLAKPFPWPAILVREFKANWYVISRKKTSKIWSNMYVWS